MITQTKKPKKFKFHSLFNNAYLPSFSSDNNSFPIKGIVPLNPKATELKAVTPLRLPERTVQGKARPPATPSPSSPRDNFSRSPALQREIRGDKKTDSCAKCLNRRKNRTENEGEPASLHIVRLLQTCRFLGLQALVLLRPIDKSVGVNDNQRMPNWRGCRLRRLSDVPVGALCRKTVSPRITVKTYLCACVMPMTMTATNDSE
jgi:hypothetical protein